MGFPPPTAKQGRILWASLTSLAIGVLLGLAGGLLWSLGWLINQLSPVLLPLAIAAIIACLLDPVVDYVERKRVPRAWAIVVVFCLAVLMLMGMVGSVVPRLVVETGALADRLRPERVRTKFYQFLEKPPFGITIPEGWMFWKKGASTTGEVVTADIPTNALPADGIEETNLTTVIEAAPAIGPPATVAPQVSTDFSRTLVAGMARVLPRFGSWLRDQVSRVASWVGLIVGLALVPVYTFYLLAEKRGITARWTDYLPVHESAVKEEVVFVIRSVNYYLVLFFRGQVLVALCDGVLLMIGFFAIGLDFAILLGLAAGLLSIVPFLGVMLSLIPVLILSVIQFGDWLHPVLVLAIFALVQMAEGLFISPKIMGDRVGLHPLTIIVAVMVGTTLMGGILGGILAIPLTAALRVLMFRYVWTTRVGPRME